MPWRADAGGHPDFQQIQEIPAHDLRDQGASGDALHELGTLGGVRVGEGLGV
jgi:hypothetical protein